MTATTISDLAREAYAALETRQRDDGETFTTTRDDAPAWVSDLVYAAHGDFLPEDWRYDCIHSALSHIADAGADDADDLDDAAHEFADGHVDVYTAGRLQWLASNLNRPAYVDDAVEQMGASDLDTTERIGLGQYVESLEVFESVRQSLADRMDDVQGEDDDAEDPSQDV